MRLPAAAARLATAAWLCLCAACTRNSTLTWHLPTKVTARIPCFDSSVLRPGESETVQRSRAAIYRWLDVDGNAVGAAFYQTLRLLQLPLGANVSDTLECLVYDWGAKLQLTVTHQLLFYERASTVFAASVGFRSRTARNEFYRNLTSARLSRRWCSDTPACRQLLLLQDRNPTSDFAPLLRELSAVDSSPLGEMLRQLRRPDGEGQRGLHRTTALLLLAQPAQPESLKCQPRLHTCRVLALQLARAAQLKLRAMLAKRADEFIEHSAKGGNYTLKAVAFSLCPGGYEPLPPHPAAAAAGRSQQPQLSEALLCRPCGSGQLSTSGLACMRVPPGHYSAEPAATAAAKCPEGLATDGDGVVDRDGCVPTGTLVWRQLQLMLRAAWTEMELAVGEQSGSWLSAVLLAHSCLSVYFMFRQGHRLLRGADYSSRSQRTTRLLKRFAAEAFLRDVRRRQFWQAHLLRQRQG